MFKKIVYILPLFLFGVFRASAAKAVCPVCAVAVGAGVGLTRYLGIDDTVSGVWVGGLTVSLIMWTINWLDKKNIHFKGRKITVWAGFYLLVVAPLYWADIMGHPFNKIWGVDKLLFGVIFGSVIFYLAATLYDYLKKKNNDRAYFPFQKVAMPVGALAILSLIFYFLTK